MDGREHEFAKMHGRENESCETHVGSHKWGALETRTEAYKQTPCFALFCSLFGCEIRSVLLSLSLCEKTHRGWATTARPPCRAVAPLSSNRQRTQSPTREETVVRCASLTHPRFPPYGAPNSSYTSPTFLFGNRGEGYWGQGCTRDAHARVCVRASDQVMSILCFPTSSASRLTLCGRINRAAAP